MKTRFEVQEFCLFGGWTNTWTSYDLNTDIEKPSTFATREEAEAELEYFFKDCEEAVKDGNMEDIPDREDFRIEEISDE